VPNNRALRVFDQTISIAVFGLLLEGIMTDVLPVVHDKPGLQFEVVLDGQRAYLAYMDLGKQTLDLYRTFVPASLRGKGIAAALTEAALDYADATGYSVIASCSYVERYMERKERNRARDN
jgi:predicted GNAT family acetyltransferase